MGTRVRVLVCSALTVEVDGVAVRGRDLGSRKARTLLALLAAERGRLVPVDRIVDVLWPDGPPADPPRTSPRWSAALAGCSATR